MSRPLVSVLTPTWQRHALVVGAIENVRAQTYRPLEHVIVSDGADPRADEMVDHMALFAELEPDRSRTVPLRFIQLGRNWSTYLPASFCAAPTTVAMLVARGDYQCWLADDERMAPDHVASLVDALEAGGADFAYSRVELVWPGSGHRAIIGTDPPREGQITNALYRTDLLKRGLYPFGAGMTSDWACIKRWMDAGAVWAFVDRVTLTHQVDH
jgi:predicted nucleic acid-binding Zn finger protein